MDTAFKSFAEAPLVDQPRTAVDSAPRALDIPAVVASIDDATGTISQSPIREPRPDDQELPTERILVRQIGLIDGPDGPFGYLAPDKARPYSPAALDQILDQLRRGTYEPMAPAESFNRPLDVNCSAKTLFVFYLSDQRDWRFTRGAKAITLGKFDSEGERDNYYGLRHVLNDSIGTPDSPPDGNCKIVYFTAKKTSERFAHPFNINVELVFKNDIEGPNTLPIVIDPDVRFPGGSGE
jgi:hypothetical protein